MPKKATKSASKSGGSYCLKCKKNTPSVNPRQSRTSTGRNIVKSTCSVCDSGKSKLVSGKGIFDVIGGLF